MKRISLLALALSTTATMAVSEDYFEGGILWTTFAPQIANEIAVTSGDLYRTETSTLNDDQNNITGDDRDRVNSVEPILISKNIRNHDGVLLDHHTTVDMQTFATYGAWMEGSYKYKRELSSSLAYAPADNNFIRFEEPIEIYSDLGKINKLPLPYDEVPNKITAKALFISDAKKKILLEIKANEVLFEAQPPTGIHLDRGYSKENLVCNLQLHVNGRALTTKSNGDIYSVVFDAKKGKNTIEITQSCRLMNYISTSNDTARGAKHYYNSYRSLSGNLISKLGFAFRLVDLRSSKPITKIKNRITVKKQQPLDIHYSDEEKADPVLWTWEGLHYSKFAGSDKEQLDTSDELVLMPTPVAADLTNIELIDPEGQEYHLSQSVNARKNMYKGTFFPKTTGIYEVLVAKKSNLRHGYVNMQSGYRSLGGYVYPNYSLAMDYSRPVAHSFRKAFNLGTKPIEYDWFWFEVDQDDVKYGMDMSLHVHANLGLSYNNASEPKRLDNNYTENAEAYDGQIRLLDRSTNSFFTIKQARSIGLRASQQIGFYIKPARAEKFRKFQQSDFMRIDGSTSKHGHDIDGSSEGRINGAELLGGFD